MQGLSLLKMVTECRVRRKLSESGDEWEKYSIHRRVGGLQGPYEYQVIGHQISVTFLLPWLPVRHLPLRLLSPSLVTVASNVPPQGNSSTPWILKCLTSAWALTLQSQMLLW